jgi:hypothetical protein
MRPPSRSRREDLARKWPLPSLIELGRPEFERAMRPLAAVIVDVDAQPAVEMAAVEGQRPIQTLAAHGVDDRPATAFAFGARTGVFAMRTPSLRKTLRGA